MKEFESQRTIEEVFDVETGEIIQSKEFFKKPESEIFKYRRILEHAIKGYVNPKFVCLYCNQLLKLTGKSTSRGMVTFFTHLYDSEDCEIKTNLENKLSKKEIEIIKYCKIKESERHKHLKNNIYKFLLSQSSVNKGVCNVQLEKRITSHLPELNWRQPDISFVYKGFQFVIELQLSTTFLSVIAERDYFYKLHNIYIIWVFNFSDNSQYVNLGNMMCKDIYYHNKRNAFIIDEEAIKQSNERQELVLKCLWFEPKYEEGFINLSKSIKREKYICLSDLKRDDENFKPYYVDADKLFEENNLNVSMGTKNSEATFEQKLRHLITHCNSKLRPFKVNEKWGFVNLDGKMIIQPTYFEIQPSVEDFFYVKKDGWGVINENGVEIIECKYDYINRFELKYFIVSEFKTIKNYYANSLTFKCESIYDEQGQVLIEGEGLIKKTYLGEANDEFVYETYNCWFDHFCRIFYNKKFNHIISFSQQRLEFENGIAKVYVHYDDYDSDLEGYINKKGEIVIPVEYYKIRKFVGDIAIANSIHYSDLRSNMWGAIDKDGKQVIPFIFKEIEDFNERGYTIARFADLDCYGVINLKGETIIPAIYNEITAIKDLYICYLRKEHTTNKFVSGVLNERNEIVIPFIYSCIIHIKNFHFIVKNEKEYYIIDIDHKILTSDVYDYLEIIEDEYLICWKNRKCGLIKMDGTIIIPIQFEYRQILANKNIYVTLQNKNGVIDKYGKIIVPIIYNSIHQEKDKYVIAKLEDCMIVYDLNGVERIKLQYKKILTVTSSTGIAFVVLNNDNLWGVLNLDNKETLPFIYKTIEIHKEGYYEEAFFIVQLDNLWGVYNSKGELKTPIKYKTFKRAKYSIK